MKDRAWLLWMRARYGLRRWWQDRFGPTVTIHIVHRRAWRLTG